MLLRSFRPFSVYDVTSRASFDALPGWFSELETFSTSPDVVKCVVGNKVDKEFSRVVSREEGKVFADSQGAIFVEASAKKGVGVQGAFDDLVNQVSSAACLARDQKPPLRRSSAHSSLCIPTNLARSSRLLRYGHCKSAVRGGPVIGCPEARRQITRLNLLRATSASTMVYRRQGTTAPASQRRWTQIECICTSYDEPPVLPHKGYHVFLTQFRGCFRPSNDPCMR